MAKVIDPLLVSSVSGGIDHLIIFRETPYGPVAQSFPQKKTNTKSILLKQQIVFRDAMLKFRTLKYAKNFKRALNAQAMYDYRAIVGASLFVSRYMKNVFAGKTFSDVVVSNYYRSADGLTIEFSKPLPCPGQVRFGTDALCSQYSLPVSGGQTSLFVPFAFLEQNEVSHFQLRLNSSALFNISGGYCIDA